jgi:predicted ATPase
MLFIKTEVNNFTPSLKQYPCVVLKTDNWDDYGFKTTFYAKYYNQSGQVIILGEVKILKKNECTTKNVLDDIFESLSPTFCSLGQSLRYYKTLSQLEAFEYTEILSGLNDVATNKEIRKNFEELNGFNSSFLRTSEAEKALQEAAQYFSKTKIKKKNNIFKFNFSCQLPRANGEHDLNFDFAENKYLPYRINVLIGKNGTGKTQVLSRIANVLKGNKSGGKFLPRRPLFSKVIAISYSAFDVFEKPMQDNGNEISTGKRSSFNYIYCGIQGIDGVLSLEEIKTNLFKSYRKVVELERKDKWRKVLDQIIEHEHSHILDKVEENEENIELSSGQCILLASITEVIANIETESLLLFDEPELHLHPNAMSNLIRMFYVLLNEFNSYAIVSTHSPLILQETPSQYVRILERNVDVPRTRKLGIECFGENISNITNEVFGVKNTESNYKSWLELMAKEKTISEVMEIFDNNLSLNAMIYLNILFGSQNGGEQE